MINPYKGEFTLSPIPLELSGNYCSHKCAYCFANLNDPNRVFDPKAFINKIKNQYKSNSIESILLREKYPVLMSNKVDPFSTSNYRQTISITEILRKNGNGIAWQTRGGHNEGVDEILSHGMTECWYISIPIWDTKIAKEIEPGGTSPIHRIELIKKLIQHNQKVTVGINPTCPEFLPFSDAEELLGILKNIGVTGVWLSFLHLNAKQIGNMSKKEYDILNSYGVIEYSKKRSMNNKSHQFCLDICEMAKSVGLNVFYAGQSVPSSYFDDYYSVYKKNFRNTQGLVNYLYENYPKGIELDFENYYNWFYEPFMAESKTGCDGYIYNQARNLYSRLKIGTDTHIKSFRDILKIIWNYPEIWHSPINLECFKYIGQNEDTAVRDNEGNYIYLFKPI
jgi:DNA repair photolyase